MILAALLASASPMTAVDAERAFAADAQKIGQWAAFRKWSAEDALMFLPQRSNAHAFLKDRKEPPVAVFWWPGRSYLSCDGGHAVNTGPWVRDGGKSVGYFTTVWKRQPDGGWKWIYDAGDELKVRGEGGDISPVTASCAARPGAPDRPAAPAQSATGGGTSADGTLAWHWAVTPDGARRFQARLWTDRGWTIVVDDQVGAPPPR